jgi:hypothetical protein
MPTNTALIEKREELKRRLAAGEYKTLVDIFLEWFDRLIRKITRHTKQLPIWLITTILCLVITLMNFVSVNVAGNLTAYSNNIELLGVGYGLGALIIISPGILAIVSPIAFNQYIGRILVLWRHDIIDMTDSEASLDEFADWLEKTCNWRLHLLVTIVGGLLGGLYLTAIISTRVGIFVGYSAILTNIILSMFSSAFVYLLLVLVVFLSARLRRYNLKLFAADPSNSEIVFRLSSELSFVVYFVAVYAAIVTLLFAGGGVLTSFVIILIPGLWLPIVAMFILNQTSLSSIIRRVKWKTLNEVQGKVEKLQTSKNFGNQETMDAVKRLMDYHDRVKATRDSALDFRAYLGFINSLLLPLLAFILGNLDLVLKLFGMNP